MHAENNNCTDIWTEVTILSVIADEIGRVFSALALFWASCLNSFTGSLDFPGVYSLKWCDCKSLILFILRYDFRYKVPIQISNQ